MKLLISSLAIMFFSFNSCHAQVVETIADVPKLIDKQQQFVNKPLRILLDQIKPVILNAQGSPEEADENRTGTIIFYFVPKEEYQDRKKRGMDPIRVIVTVARPEGVKEYYPPIDRTSGWNDSIAKKYENMIVLRINILGKADN